MKAIRRSIALALVVACMLLAYGSAADMEAGTDVQPQEAPLAGAAVADEKSEVVYATLLPDGSVREAFVVNHFVVTAPGTLRDYGKYASVHNLTSAAPISLEGDLVLVEADEGNFYYQGNLPQAQLPWDILISYWIDGQQVSPEQVGGRSGKLEIRIQTEKNKSFDPAFYAHYMLQISLSMDTALCKNIVAPDATMAEAGKNRMLTFVVLPEKDADISLTAEVTDFSMAGIDISAVPFSMAFDMPDTDGFTDQFTELTDAVAKLHDGVGDLRSGVKELKSGAGQLADGSYDIQSGLLELSANAPELLEGSGMINGALIKISDSLDLSQLENLDLSGIEKLPRGIQVIVDGLRSLSSWLRSYTQEPVSAANLGNIHISEESIFALREAAAEAGQSEALDQLLSYYDMAGQFADAYEAMREALSNLDVTLDSVIEKIDALADTLSEIISKMDESLGMLDQLDQLTLLADGLEELSDNYGEFHSGLVQYMEGVWQLTDGYVEFNEGLFSFTDGVGELKTGVDEMHDGTGKMNKETAKMPDTIQEEIDNLMAEYKPEDFTPVSYISPKNNVELVQFVLKCDGIEAPEKDKAEEAPPTEATFWDRLMVLFHHA